MRALLRAPCELFLDLSLSLSKSWMPWPSWLLCSDSTALTWFSFAWITCLISPGVMNSSIPIHSWSCSFVMASADILSISRFIPLVSWIIISRLRRFSSEEYHLDLSSSSLGIKYNLLEGENVTGRGSRVDMLVFWWLVMIRFKQYTKLQEEEKRGWNCFLWARQERGVGTVMSVARREAASGSNMYCTSPKAVSSREYW